MNENNAVNGDSTPRQIKLTKRGVVSFENGRNDTVLRINSEAIVEEARAQVDSAKPKMDWAGKFAGVVTLTIEFLGDMESEE